MKALSEEAFIRPPVPSEPAATGEASLKVLLDGNTISLRGIDFDPAVEAAMINLRILATAVLSIGLTLSVAAAESTPSEDLSSGTAGQHHLWSQKFDIAPEPQTTGSIASPTAPGPDTSSLACVPAGLAFSNPPFLDWHIGSCS
jgi:hypothetical protein